MSENTQGPGSHPPEDDWEGTTAASEEGLVESGSEEPVDGPEESGSFEADPQSLSDLKSLRKLIDQKNKSIVRLLNRRAGYALRIAEVKRIQNLPIRDDEREREVLKKVSRYNKGPLTDEALHRIFACIMEEHRKLEGEHNGDASASADMGIDHER